MMGSRHLCEQLQCMELCREMDKEPAETLWVRIKELIMGAILMCLL